eukprot:XP_010660447.1 PREDICTED: uncharacterized protein LOC104881573 [Vitis vinifera]
MPALRTEREIRGFLGILQYINRFIARLTDICEPIFHLLRKSQPTVWDDDCQHAFEKIKECLLSSSVLVPPTPGRPLLLYLSISEIATRKLRQYVTEYSILVVSRLDPLRYLFDMFILTSRLMKWLVLLKEFDIQYITQKSVKGSIVTNHLASLPVSDEKPVDDDFPDEQYVSVTSIAGWRLYFDGFANQSGFGIGILLISPQGYHIPRSVRLAFFDHHQLMNNVVEYEACITGLEIALDLGVRQLEIHRDSNLVIQQTQGIWRTRDEKLKPYHAYLDLLVDRFEELRYIHLPRAKNQFDDALATLAFVIEIPMGVTMRSLLIETRSAPAYCCLIGDIKDQDGLPWYHDIYQFLSCGAYPESTTIKDKRALRQLVTRFVICGESLYRRSPDGLLLLCLDRTSTNRVMREISPKSSSEHEYILVAIDYFTKWVEAASYAKLTAAMVAKFIRSHIICRYRIPHELISDREHHRSSTYRPQTNGIIEATNKNIKRILRMMVETSRDWSKKLPFTLWAYRTSFCTSTGATPYSLVYGMKAVLPVEIEMGSLRVALE